MGERIRKTEKERNKSLTSIEKQELENFFALEFAKSNDYINELSDSEKLTYYEENFLGRIPKNVEKR